ncbi:MAG: hypothetical protein IJF17_14085 [Thermoguttaceae bacterium]|nr:hypothetical protein [Thermoguttaceae bacterium]
MKNEFGDWIVSINTPDDVAKIGAEWLAEHSQGQTVKRPGRPRKQAENGPAEGQASGSGGDPKNSPARGRGRRELIPRKVSAAVCGDFFLMQYADPVFLLFGSQWLRYDDANGWRLCVDDGPARRLVERFLAERYKDDFTEKLSRDVFAYVRAKWSICKEFDYKSWWIHTDPETRSLKAVEAPYWLACRNRVLNVKTRKTLNYTPRLLTVGRIPCDYDPAADCVKFKRFLESVLQPDDVENFLMACGISLIYERQKSNVFFVLYGDSGTGKSTFLKILSKINEGTVCSVSLSDFGERFGMVDVTTHRVNIVEDMENIYEGGKVSKREADLKKIACGEIIKDGEKYQKATERPALAICFFGANRIPRFADTSEAISDRMRLFLFPNKFRGTEKQNCSIADEIIKDELPGVLNLFLEHLTRFFGLLENPAPGKKTFPESESGAAEKIKAIQAARPWELWIEENLEVVEEGKVETRKVYEKYRVDSLASGYSPKAENQFVELVLDYYRKRAVPVQKKRVQNGTVKNSYYIRLNLLNDGKII